jgi:surface protein
VFSNALDANRLTNLTSISFENFNTSKVTDMHYMFESCSSLTSLDLSSFDMSKVTDSTYIFVYCSGLTEIKTPKAIGSAAVDLPTKTGYLWVDKNNTSTKYTKINSTNVGKTLILKAN